MFVRSYICVLGERLFVSKIAAKLNLFCFDFRFCYGFVACLGVVTGFRVGLPAKLCDQSASCEFFCRLERGRSRKR